MQDAVIVSATRTAVGKAPAGSLRTVRPDEMAATVIKEALRRAPGVEPSAIDDVIIGDQVQLLAPLVLAVLGATLIQGVTSFSLTQLLSNLLKTSPGSFG